MGDLKATDSRGAYDPWLGLGLTDFAWSQRRATAKAPDGTKILIDFEKLAIHPELIVEGDLASGATDRPVVALLRADGTLMVEQSPTHDLPGALVMPADQWKRFPMLPDLLERVPGLKQHLVGAPLPLDQ